MENKQKCEFAYCNANAYFAFLNLKDFSIKYRCGYHNQLKQSKKFLCKVIKDTPTEPSKDS